MLGQCDSDDYGKAGGLNADQARAEVAPFQPEAQVLVLLLLVLLLSRTGQHREHQAADQPQCSAPVAGLLLGAPLNCE